MASGSGWMRPPERSITGRSTAASVSASTKARFMGRSRSEIQEYAVVAQRAGQAGRRRRQPGLLDREIEGLIEECVAGLLLEFVPERSEERRVGKECRYRVGGVV